MASRLSRLLATTVVVAITVSLSACGGSSKRSGTAGLATRTVKFDGLDVVVTPARIDATGAAFNIAFDTHTGATGIDVAAKATLTVGGATWSGATWSGDGPGGHHRAGTLRFRAGGPPSGTARLSIAGLPGPLTVTWQVSPSRTV